MPKAIVIDDEEAPRRRRAKTPVADVEVERNLVLRVLLHSPKDTVAGVVAAGAVLAILINALFMQRGHHPAPMFNIPFPAQTPAAKFVAPVAPQATNSVSNPLPRPRPLEAESRAAEPARAVEPQRPAAAQRTAAPAHSDPVGDLIVSNRRATAVQRALTEFGYGQLKPTGIVGPDTTVAIQRFERERKLPVTGQISDRLVRELSAMTGRTIE